jgi:hypothetical protein
MFALSFYLILNSLYAQTNNDVLISLKEFLNFSPNSDRIIENKIWGKPDDPKIWEWLIITQELNIDTPFFEINCYNRNKNDSTWDGILIRYCPKETSNNSFFNYILIKDAKQIYQEVINVFGPPDRILDYGFLSESPYRQDFIAQWDNGQYSIQIRFSDSGYIFDKPGIDLIVLEVKNAGTFPNIIPLIGINIISKSGYFSDNKNNWYPLTKSDVDNKSTMSLILDYNREKVLLQNFQERGEIIDISDSRATLVFYENQKKLIEIILNRYTGETEYTSYDDKGTAIVKYKGVAERMELKYRPLF